MPSGGFRGHGVRRLIVIRHNGLASGVIFIKKCFNFFFFFFKCFKKKKKKKIAERSELLGLHALRPACMIHLQRYPQTASSNILSESPNFIFPPSSEPPFHLVASCFHKPNLPAPLQLPSPSVIHLLCRLSVFCLLKRLC